MIWWIIVIITTMYQPNLGYVVVSATNNSQLSRTIDECNMIKKQIENTSDENNTVVCAKVLIK